MTENGERARTVAAVFDRSASTYEAVGVAWFVPVSERLVAELQPQPGEHALDIGCGRGAAVFPLAQAVGPAGKVVGIDLAPSMIDLTRRDVETAGLTNVELAVDDASAPQLAPDSFDLLLASCVLFFLPEPVDALRSWCGILRPGGRLGLSTWGERPEEWTRLDDVFARHTPAQPSTELRSAQSAQSQRNPFTSDQGVEGLLLDAGLTDVRTIHFPLSAHFDDAEHWYRWSWSHGARAAWERIPEERRADALADAARVLEAVRAPDGRLALTQDVRLTLARRPPR